MDKAILSKVDLAKYFGISEKSISTACSRNPSSLPKFFKLGVSSNSPVRFRREDVLAFEAAMLARQEQLQTEAETMKTTELTSLLSL